MIQIFVSVLPLFMYACGLGVICYIHHLARKRWEAERKRLNNEYQRASLERYLMRSYLGMEVNAIPQTYHTDPIAIEVIRANGEKVLLTDNWYEFPSKRLLGQLRLLS